MKIIYICFLLLYTTVSNAIADNNTDWKKAQQITVGSSVSKRIDDNGFSDWYRVNVTKYGKTHFKITAINLCISMYVYGNKADNINASCIDDVITDNIQANDNSKMISVPLKPGTYYIYIGNIFVSDASSKYILQVSQDDEIQPSNISENDNIFSDANFLQLNQVFTGNIAYYDETSSVDDSDWLIINVYKYGMVDFKISAQNFNTCMYIYGNKGENTSVSKITSAYVDDYLANDNSQVISIPLMPGTYYVLIGTHYEVPISGVYSLLVTQSSEKQPDITLENDNSFSEAYQIDFNHDFTGNISYYDENVSIDNEDWFKIVIKKYGVVNFKLSAQKIMTSLTIFGNKGENTSGLGIGSMEVKDYQSNDNTSTISKPLIPGTYYIKISPMFLVTAGIYVLNVTQDNETQPDYNDECDNEFTEAKKININQVYIGNIAYYDSKSIMDTNDWYKVELTKYGLTNFKISAQKFAITMEIFGNKGEFTSSKSIRQIHAIDYQANDNSVINTIPLMPGIYYLRISKLSNYYNENDYPHSGVYSLIVTQHEEIQPYDTNENDNSFIDAKHIQLNKNYFGNIEYYDEESFLDIFDWYKIIISYEGDIDFKISAKGFGVTMKLYENKGQDPKAGSLSVVNATDYQAEENSAVIHEHLSPDTYYISISKYIYSLNSLSGIYQLSISDSNLLTEVEIKLVSPNTYRVYYPGDSEMIRWETSNAKPIDEIVISMKRRSVTPEVTEPDSINWYRFTENGVKNTNERHEAMIVIPSGLSVADDWRFYVRHKKSNHWSSSDVVFSYRLNSNDLYTKEQFESALSEIIKKYDPNENGIIELIEVIYYLQQLTINR